MNRSIRLFNTVKYLKFRQIYYRLYYFFRRKWRNIIGFKYLLTVDSKSIELLLSPSILGFISYEQKTFTFLNLSHSFKENINWNYVEHGKLWTYNLNYFDFLQQEELNKEDGQALIHDFIRSIELVNDGVEPFPTSLRGINWIKFLVREKIFEQKINDSLFAQYQLLIDNIEYHLLGNHLLENGFSLLFGAYYFQDEKLYTKAKEILVPELNEQILDDGAHFELSPMYHQIMLFRVLDCINLIQNNPWKNNTLLALLSEKATLMLGWLNTITFKNGGIPLLNDSANHIAPTTAQLNDYASNLDILVNNFKIAPCESGYRKIQKDKYECIIDVGNIGPDYIPGHAHSDTFNFELYVNGKPLIVDTGISTYEANETRQKERSTSAHNTVQIDGMEQSAVWGGFRVANRAKVISLNEKDNVITAVHDGYKKSLGALHQREFVLNDGSIRIIDTVLSERGHNAVARFHFHPDVNVKVIDHSIFVNDVQIKQHGASQKFKANNYLYSPEFNKQTEATVLEIPFNKKLDIEIIL